MATQKFDLGNIAEKLKAKFDKKDPKMARAIGLGSSLRTLTEKDFVTMPSWWKQATNTQGIAFGKFTTLAGRTDSGKTSASIEAIKAALEQGCGVIYVESEGKTTPNDFINWGIDPDQIMLVNSNVAERAFALMFEYWDAFKSKYPEASLLVVFDSIGGLVSMRDDELDMSEGNSKPGGKGQVAKLALNKAVAKMENDNVAFLLISYTYSNIGSVGRTTAGGEAVERGSALIYQTARKGWVEKTVKGEKVRVGAEVVWTLQKNHIDKVNPGPKKVILRINSEGITFVGDGEAGS